MPDYLGAEQRKVKEDEKDDGPIRGIYNSCFKCEILAFYVASIYPIRV